MTHEPSETLTSKAGHLGTIRAAAADVAAAERALFVAVCRARELRWRRWNGALEQAVSWEAIGQALGISKQAAAKRFGGWRYDEPTDQLIRERPLL